MRILGVVIAGGRATRMGGSDKGLQTVAGEPMAQIAAKKLSHCVDAVAVNANRSKAQYEAMGLMVIEDSVEGFQGPLAGMLASLERARDLGFEAILTVPCDVPGFPDCVPKRLIASFNDSVKIVCVRAGGRLQPVFALMRTELIESLKQALSSGEHRVGHWMQSNQAFCIEFDQLDGFENINTFDDLKGLNQKKIDSVSLG